MDTDGEIENLLKSAENIHANAKELSKKLYSLMKKEKIDSDDEENISSQVAKAYKASSDAKTNAYSTVLFLSAFIRDSVKKTK